MIVNITFGMRFSMIIMSSFTLFSRDHLEHIRTSWLHSWLLTITCWSSSKIKCSPKNLSSFFEGFWNLISAAIFEKHTKALFSFVLSCQITFCSLQKILSSAKKIYLRQDVCISYFTRNHFSESEFINNSSIKTSSFEMNIEPRPTLYN